MQTYSPYVFEIQFQATHFMFLMIILRANEPTIMCIYWCHQFEHRSIFLQSYFCVHVQGSSRGTYGFCLGQSNCKSSFQQALQSMPSLQSSSLVRQQQVWKWETVQPNEAAEISHQKQNGTPDAEWIMPHLEEWSQRAGFPIWGEPKSLVCRGQ